MSPAITMTTNALTASRKKYKASTRPAIVEAFRGKSGKASGHISLLPVSYQPSVVSYQRPVTLPPRYAPGRDKPAACLWPRRSRRRLTTRNDPRMASVITPPSRTRFKATRPYRPWLGS